MVADQRRIGDARREPLRDGGFAPTLMFVPPGTFVMGMIDGEGRDEEILDHTIAETRPRPTVTFTSGFWMARDPVTVGEYRRFMQAQPRRERCLGMWSFEGGEPDDDERRTWENPGFAQGDDHPVVGVSWTDARAYVDWLNQHVGYDAYRLPGEAAWEYACRAGTTTARYWGDGWDSDRANAGGGHGGTTPVGRFDANPWGLRDMIGNVWEWTADPWIRTLAGYPTDGSSRAGDVAVRAIRGGAWSYIAKTARAGYRNGIDARYRMINVGFRVARSLIP